MRLIYIHREILCVMTNYTWSQNAQNVTIYVNIFEKFLTAYLPRFLGHEWRAMQACSFFCCQVFDLLIVNSCCLQLEYQYSLHIALPFKSKLGICGWQKMTLVFSSVLQKKTMVFGLVSLYKINCGFDFSVRFLHCMLFNVYALYWVQLNWFRIFFELHLSVDTIFHLCLYGMMLEMTYFRAELVQLIVSRSDSVLEVQRHGMKKNTLTVNPVPLEDELWMRQCEKLSPNCRSWFLKTKLRKLSFQFLNFWGQFGSLFRKLISDIFIGFRTPLL